MSPGFHLSFALIRFSQDASPLVVFGHSLSESDQHLLDVLRNQEEGRPIAISMRRASGSIRERKARLIALLPDAKLEFFDAETHPLGVADLKAEVRIA